MMHYPPKVMIPVQSIMTGIGFTFQVLRLWVRSRMLPSNMRGLRAADYLSLIGCLITAACTALQIWSAVSGTAGNRATDKTVASQYQTQLIVGDVQPMIEPIALGATKLSLVLFYQDFIWVDASFLRLSWISAWTIVVWALAFFIAELSICGNHLPDLWSTSTEDLAGKNCGDKGALLLAFAATSVLTDLMVILLPVFCLKKLLTDKRRRWAVSGLFMIGFAATVACLLRFIFLCVAYNYGTLKLQNAGNKIVAKVPDWIDAFNPTFWVTIEMWTSSWAANLIALGPLLSKGWLGR